MDKMLVPSDDESQMKKRRADEQDVTKEQQNYIYYIKCILHAIDHPQSSLQ